MSENKLRNREVIDAELQKTKAELAIANTGRRNSVTR